MMVFSSSCRSSALVREPTSKSPARTWETNWSLMARADVLHGVDGLGDIVLGVEQDAVGVLPGVALNDADTDGVGGGKHQQGGEQPRQHHKDGEAAQHGGGAHDGEG